MPTRSLLFGTIQRVPIGPRTDKRPPLLLLVLERKKESLLSTHLGRSNLSRAQWPYLIGELTVNLRIILSNYLIFIIYDITGTAKPTNYLLK